MMKCLPDFLGNLQTTVAMLIGFQRQSSVPEGGRKGIDPRQEMGCAKLKPSENFCRNYNSVQLALTLLLKGPDFM